jgi:hypothetical protein
LGSFYAGKIGWWAFKKPLTRIEKNSPRHETYVKSVSLHISLRLLALYMKKLMLVAALACIKHHQTTQ